METLLATTAHLQLHLSEGHGRNFVPQISRSLSSNNYITWHPKIVVCRCFSLSHVFLKSLTYFLGVYFPVNHIELEKMPSDKVCWVYLFRWCKGWSPTVGFWHNLLIMKCLQKNTGWNILNAWLPILFRWHMECIHFGLKHTRHNPCVYRSAHSFPGFHPMKNKSRGVKFIDSLCGCFLK